MIFRRYKNINFNGESKLDALTLKYEGFIIALMHKENVSANDYTEIIENISVYLINSIQSNISRPNLTDPIDKKIAYFYNQYKFLFSDLGEFHHEVDEEFSLFAQDAILTALGFGKKEKRFEKTNEKSNFILYSFNLFKYQVLNFLEKKVSSVKNMSYETDGMTTNNIDDEIAYEDIITKLLSEKRVFDSFGEEQYKRIKESLLSGEIPDDLKSIVQYITKGLGE